MRRNANLSSMKVAYFPGISRSVPEVMIFDSSYGGKLSEEFATLGVSQTSTFRPPGFIGMYQPFPFVTLNKNSKNVCGLL
jgi:hypothetical protein